MFLDFLFTTIFVILEQKLQNINCSLIIRLHFLYINYNHVASIKSNYIIHEIAQKNAHLEQLPLHCSLLPRVNIRNI